MKKNIIICLLVLSAVVLFTAGAAFAGPTPRVIVNGRTINLDAPPVERNGMLFVPLRGIFENLGAKVSFDKGTGKISAYRGKNSVQLFVGNSQAKVNGFTSHIMVAPFENNGRAYVPLRFVSEAMGCEVNWHPPTGVATITTVATTTKAPRKKSFAEQQIEALIKDSAPKEKDDGKIKKINSGIKKIEPIKGIEPINSNSSKKEKTKKEKDNVEIEDIKLDD
ncbi:MAG: copper amine oxidase N-terminal domain-containing protein [Firmicutes bacterium]|nr:copper amine oxidase N-terminal domain-containing protein [Bacillota bacterium]